MFIYFREFDKGVFTAINIIDEDFKVANTCRLALARKIESMPGPFAWTLTKKSPYTPNSSQKGSF